MGRKNKSDNEYASTEPFSLAVCNRIRWCVGKQGEAVAKRKEAFEHRDSMKSQLASLLMASATGGPVNDAKLKDAKAAAYDAERSIEEWQHQINFYRKTIADTVEQADSPELDGMMDERPVYTRPVEKPSEPRETKPAVEKDAGVAVGVDEHLAASVNELDLPDLLQSRLVRGGYTTVGAVVGFLKGKASPAASIADELGVAVPKAEAVIKAVEVYRKKHQRAILDVEREEIAAAGGV